MKRRKFLLGVGSAAAAGSALIGSGAFSQVDAQRQVTIQVAEDPNAYLGMNDCIGRDGEPTANSSFAEIDEDGHLAVDMGPSGYGPGDGGQGVNSESISWFDNVFQLCNQGKECVGLWIDEKRGDDPERVTFYVDSDKPPARYVEDDLATRQRVQNDSGLRETGNSREDAIQLDLGECVCVGIQTYTREDDSYEITNPSEGDQLLEGVTISADVEASVCDGGQQPCARLSAQFDCITEVDGTPTGHTIDVFNNGTAGTEYGVAILDSPDEEDPIGGGDENPIEPDIAPPNSSSRYIADSSFPLGGIIWWNEDCGDVDAPTAAEWGGISTPTQVGNNFDWSTVTGAGPSRYSEVTNISSIAEFEAAFVEDEQEPELSIPRDAYVAEIDYTGLDPQRDWQDEQDNYFCE